MTNVLSENEQIHLSPTYAILTGERVLDRFGIRLKHPQLIAAIQNSKSVYYQLLQVPFYNIINGIIYQHCYDYQVFAQKLFVDYLVSGEGNEEPQRPGETVREDLEQNRLKLVGLGEQFDKDAMNHKKLIHQTQAHLLELTRNMKPIDDNEQNSLIVSESMKSFLEQSKDLSQGLKNYRTEFRTLIIDTLRLMALLPNYESSPEQQAENLATIEFDNSLGDESIIVDS
jgi:hypothetical protein